jgi:hypothetical protein
LWLEVALRVMALRHLALSYQIAFITPKEIDMTCGDCLFVVCLFASAIEGAVPPKSAARRSAEVFRKNYVKFLALSLPSTEALRMQ